MMIIYCFFIIFILLPVKNKDFIIMLLSLFRVYMQCPWILWIQQWHNSMLPLRYVHVCAGLLECKLTFSTQNSILYFWNFWESSFGAWVSCLDFSKIEFWRNFQTLRFWWSAVRKQLISFSNSSCDLYLTWNTMIALKLVYIRVA